MGMLRRIEPRRLMAGTTPWAVDQLFASGEQGAWYDPSDMATLYQDSAGTTPVTAVEQYVGRMLDKSGRGNHAIQATTMKRPLLSARYNLLTNTEGFGGSGAAFLSAVNTTVTTNAGLSPAGTVTAIKLTENTANNIHGAYSGGLNLLATESRTVLVFAKAAERTAIAINIAGGAVGAVFDLTSGTVVVVSGSAATQNRSAYIKPVGDGWYLCAMTFTENTDLLSTAIRWLIQNNPSSTNTNPTYTGDGSSGIYIWGASLTLATDAHLPYQRVNTATDYDAAPAKFPAYAQEDGADDALTSATGGGGTTGFFFSSAILTTLAGAKQVLWSDAGTNTGYEVSINASNKLQLSVGTGATRVTVESAALSINTRYVLTAWHDGTNIYVRVNNSTPVSAACGTASAGTAGFTRFCENGASAGYFRGRSYGLVHRKDAAPGPATIDAVVRYLAAKSGGPV